MISNLFNTRVCLGTEGKYCCLKIQYLSPKIFFVGYVCPFSPCPPLKLVFLGETLSLFAISGSLHKSPANTMMTARIHNDDDDDDDDVDDDDDDDDDDEDDDDDYDGV